MVQLVSLSNFCKWDANESYLDEIALKFNYGRTTRENYNFQRTENFGRVQFKCEERSNQWKQGIKFGYINTPVNRENYQENYVCKGRACACSRLVLTVEGEVKGISPVSSPSGWVRVCDVRWGVECQSTLFADQTSAQILYNVFMLQYQNINNFLSETHKIFQDWWLASLWPT